MKKNVEMIIFSAFLLVVVACSNQSTKTNLVSEVIDSQDVSLTVNQTNMTVTSWKIDNSHVRTVKGRVLVGGKPVEGAVVQITDKRTTITDQKGEFHFLVNRNNIDKKRIHVINVDVATVKGKKLSKETKQALLGKEVYVLVYYPIKIEKVVAHKDSKLVDVHARAMFIEKKGFPTFVPDKFKVGGTIKDADGKPIVGARVNLRRDGVEGFTISEPSDKQGKYKMYYLPEDDENHYFYVHYKGSTYTLPPKKVFLFPNDVSVNIDITLPKEGHIIIDQPPYLVTTTAPGALYKGTLIGVNVGKNVEYSVTIPRDDGRFVLTLPRKEWEKSPTFFETNFSGFLLEDKKDGDILTKDMIPEVKATEPNEVIANK